MPAARRHWTVTFQIVGAPGNTLMRCARIAARFSQGRDAESVQVEIQSKGGVGRILNVTPVSADDIAPSWYI